MTTVGERGKLCQDAEMIFCCAYGLDSKQKLDHATTIPQLMSMYECSFRSVVSLLYGTSYNKRLKKWRALVPRYGEHYSLDDIHLKTLPLIATYNASSVNPDFSMRLGPVPKVQLIKDTSQPMQNFLKSCNFAIQTNLERIFAIAEPSTVYCLDTMLHLFSTEQKMVLADQLASLVLEISTKRPSRQTLWRCGNLVPDKEGKTMTLDLETSTRTIKQYVKQATHGELPTLNQSAQLLAKFSCHGQLWASNLSPENIYVTIVGIFFPPFFPWFDYFLL